MNRVHLCGYSLHRRADGTITCLECGLSAASVDLLMQAADARVAAVNFDVAAEARAACLAATSEMTLASHPDQVWRVVHAEAEDVVADALRDAFAAGVASVQTKLAWRELQVEAMRTRLCPFCKREHSKSTKTEWLAENPWCVACLTERMELVQKTGKPGHGVFLVKDSTQASR